MTMITHAGSRYCLYILALFILGTRSQSVASGYTAQLSEGFNCLVATFFKPQNCLAAKDAADQADSEAKANVPAYWTEKSLHNGLGDAFRHCYWNALMTIRIGDSQVIYSNSWHTVKHLCKA